MSYPPQPPHLVGAPGRAWEQAYRDEWRWDGVHWGTHCVDCYPGNCPMRVYVRNGKIVREEQAGTFDPVERGVPDFNPMGCQKGAAWSQTLSDGDRVTHPLRRVGERGEGRWERISWDEAVTEVADAMLDSIEEVGPESIIALMGAEGGTWTYFGLGRLLGMAGGLMTDINAEINDFSPGIYTTFGKFNLCSSLDDIWHAELILIFQANPVYTVIASDHYTYEARYNGSEVILFAPDCSPSHIHADYYLPVRTGTDAAWALGACQVIIEERLYDERFVKEQTDLPLLARTDTGRYLRQSDLRRGGSDEQFYWWDGGPVKAPRGTLDPGSVNPALEGRWQVTLADGRTAEVTTVFELLKAKLNREFTPELAGAICGMHPDSIRMLGRKVAAKRTAAWAGGTSLKYYHSDLMVRAVILLLGLTGNWGKKGTGIGCWAAGYFDGPGIFGMKAAPGQEAARAVVDVQRAAIAALREEDPTMTDEIAVVELSCRMVRSAGTRSIPPAFFWYYHCGYRDTYNRAEWSDPSMKRRFDDYMGEALEKGWWQGTIRTPEDVPPRVVFQSGGNTLRRVRGGQTMLLKHLWPKLRKVVTLDWRMSTTALMSDVVLPITNQYESPRFHIPTPHMLLLIHSERAGAPPGGQALSEWGVTLLLARKLEDRARARGMLEYVDRGGVEHSLAGLFGRLTLGGQFVDEEEICEEWVKDAAVVGTIPADMTLESLRAQGFQRFVDSGLSPMAITQAADIKPDETFAHSTDQTEKRLPYPTLTRRAQFYIDHDWFLEASEQLPTHKENPAMGGEHPFVMTTGHSRWGVHSINITNTLMLNTHRGEPHLVMNTQDAAARGIGDNDVARVFNDQAAFVVPVKTSPSVRPGQVIIYNGWDPYQFRGWKGPMDVEPGMVKWLHLAGGYGHLRFWSMQWQPTPVDRAVRVDVERA